MQFQMQNQQGTGLTNLGGQGQAQMMQPAGVSPQQQMPMASVQGGSLQQEMAKGRIGMQNPSMGRGFPGGPPLSPIQDMRARPPQQIGPIRGQATGFDGNPIRNFGPQRGIGSFPNPFGNRGGFGNPYGGSRGGFGRPPQFGGGMYGGGFGMQQPGFGGGFGRPPMFGGGFGGGYGMQPPMFGGGYGGGYGGRMGGGFGFGGGGYRRMPPMFGGGNPFGPGFGGGIGGMFPGMGGGYGMRPPSYGGFGGGFNRPMPQPMPIGRPRPIKRPMPFDPRRGMLQRVETKGPESFQNNIITKGRDGMMIY